MSWMRQCCDAAILAAAAEPDGVAADVGHFAVLDRHVPCAVGRDRRRHAHRRLAVAVALRRQRVLVVLEAKPLKRDVLDEAAAAADRRRTAPSPASTGATTSAFVMSSPGSGM